MTEYLGNAAYQQERIDQLRAAGVTPPKEMLDALKAQQKLEAENDEIRARAKKKREDERAGRDADSEADAEAELKAAGLQAFIGSGGRRAEFDAAWPELRKEMVKRRTQEYLASQDAAAAANLRRLHGVF